MKTFVSFTLFFLPQILVAQNAIEPKTLNELLIKSINLSLSPNDVDDKQYEEQAKQVEKLVPADRAIYEKAIQIFMRDYLGWKSGTIKPWNGNDLVKLIEQAKKDLEAEAIESNKIQALAIERKIKTRKAILELSQEPGTNVAEELEKYKSYLILHPEELKKNQSLSHFVSVNKMTDEKTPILVLKGVFDSGTKFKDFSLIWVDSRKGAFFKFYREETPFIYGEFSDDVQTRFGKEKMEVITGNFTDRNEVQFSSKIGEDFLKKIIRFKKLLVKVSFQYLSDTSLYSFDLNWFEEELADARKESTQ